MEGNFSNRKTLLGSGSLADGDHSEKSGLKPEPDEDDIEKADIETMKAREWDEFKEANPRFVPARYPFMVATVLLTSNFQGIREYHQSGLIDHIRLNVKADWMFQAHGVCEKD